MILKDKICEKIDFLKNELVKIAKTIFQIAELSHQEFRSSKLLADFLQENGFSVERKTGGLETAFTATAGRGKPKIALLAEYDALPAIGHACGHNMIGTMSCGAAVGLKKAFQDLPFTLVVVGCPAEEHGAGKKELIKAGVFKDVDVAMMIHPASMSTGFDIAYAIRRFKIEFFGKSAHAAADPAKGINALDAMVLLFSSIGLLRQQLPEKVRIHGIITNGGQSFNTIPEYTSAEIGLRALRIEEVDFLEQKLRSLVQEACNMTGCTSNITVEEEMPEVYVNVPLAKTLEENYKFVGEKIAARTYEQGVGSTDMGAVTQIVPAIHAYINITGDKIIPTHTKEFAEASNSEYGYNAMIRATKALALTVFDLVNNSNLLEQVKEYFINRRREF
ncbi:MAG TPA: M20 family metallopeptidase [Pseudothermotoga sp.]